MYKWCEKIIRESEGEGQWITVNGRHILIGKTKGGKDKAIAFSKKEMAKKVNDAKKEYEAAEEKAFVNMQKKEEIAAEKIDARYGSGEAGQQRLQSARNKIEKEFEHEISISKNKYEKLKKAFDNL